MSVDEYTSEFISQFMSEIDTVRREFKVKNIKCQVRIFFLQIWKPFQVKTLKKNHANLKVQKIAPLLGNQSKFDEQVSLNQSKSTFHLSHYRSLDPRLLLQQIERGKLPRPIKLQESIKEEQPSTKFRTLHRETMSLFNSPQAEQITNHPMNITNYRVEPLSKYDEGAIIFHEQDEAYVEKLKQGMNILGLTKCTINGQLEWTTCNILKWENNLFLVYVNCLNKTKWVSRANLLFEDENQEQFEKRFNQARKLRELNLHRQSLQFQVDEIFQEETVLMHKNIMNGIVDYTFQSKYMKPQKEKYLCEVVEQSVDNFKSSVLRFSMDTRNATLPNQKKIQTMLQKIEIFSQNDEEIHMKFINNQDYFQSISSYLCQHFCNIGIVNQLKPKEKLDVVKVIISIIEHTDQAAQFRLFNGIKSLEISQFLVQLNGQYESNISKLDMEFYRIESAIEKLKKWMHETLTIQISKSISVNPFDHSKSINFFESKIIATFNRILTSHLHISIEDSFQQLIDYFQPYYTLIPFDISNDLRIQKERAMTLLKLGNGDKLLINNVPSFSRQVTNMKKDLELLINTYEKLFETINTSK